MRKVVALVFMVMSLLVFTTCKKDIGPNDAYACENLPHAWTADVQPIINTYCAISGCHDASFPNANYTTYQGIKDKADNGSLYNRLFNLANMPPATAPQPSSLELQKIRCWIEDGAPQN